jgi:tetratricopeptide (TPR) repeat protein
MQQVFKGQYYLRAGKYSEGVTAFQDEAKAHPNAPAVHYYLGRLLLAQDRAAEALPELQAAVRLAPGDVDYHYWTGVAQGVLGQADAERASYLEALRINPRHGDALTYLGHNLLERGDISGALTRYQEALGVWPYNPVAMHNRALCLHRLGRGPEAAKGYKEFLAAWPDGALARSAVTRLNALGDYSWRNHLVGRRTVTMPALRFAPGDADILAESAPSLNHLAAVLDNTPGVVLHVLVYQQGNKSLAEARARAVRARLLQGRREIAPRVRMSWFDKAEEVRAGNQVVRLSESVSFFTQALPASVSTKS